MNFFYYLKNILRNLTNYFLEFFDLKISRINPKIIEQSKIEKEIIKISRKYSVTSEYSMHALVQAIKYSKNMNLKGSFVECGVWKGGNIILFQKINLMYNLKKEIFGYDTFEGMSEPSKFDINLDGVSASYKNIGTAAISKKEVINNIRRETKLTNIKLIEGKVEDTLLLERNLPKKISILRLDTDWYSSTKIELEILYKRLEKNGVLFIDDYGVWGGSKKAVDEFFKKKDIWLHVLDNGCRYMIKY